MIFEVVTNSYRSAVHAEAGGADRIELCAALEVGGITPSYGLIKQVKRQVKIPIHVLIRPRAGNFVYTAPEIEIIKNDILFCKEIGVEGVVIGMLTDEGSLDKQTLKALIEVARPMKVICHRAFDRAKDPYAALQVLIDCGVDTLLTSGQKPSALDGIELLTDLIKRAKDQITIMPGGGVTVDNVSEILQKTKAQAIHFSGKQFVKNDVTFSKEGFFDKHWETNVEEVQEMIARGRRVLK